MKTAFATLSYILILCLGATKLDAQNLDNPGDYITAMNNAHSEMDATYMAYQSAVAHSGRARKIEKMRQHTIESITNCKYKIIDLPIYKGDNSLRQSSLAYVDLLYKVYNDDYAHVVNMEDIAEQSYDEMQAYLLLKEKINEKLDSASESEHQAVKTFAAKYDVKLIEEKTDLGEMLEEAGKLNHYHNEVYLLFFKCNWEDGLLTDAENKRNITNIEQARSALINYATEGLAGLDTLRSFEGDMALAGACRQALTFYKTYAQNDVPKFTSQILANENFEKMKAAYDRKADHTQADVDAYNKAVNDLNASVNSFNQTVANVNSKRSQVIDNWNNTEKSFDDEHMPHYK
jgi:hypothetical protein